MYYLMNAPEILRRFLDMGGPVLIIIGIATFIMWTLVFERLWYFKFALGQEIDGAIDRWENRRERKSWNAQQIRHLLIARVEQRIDQNLPMIQTLVALAPLLGLLGTVTGMIEVFQIMAATGGGDAKLMAGGVSRATIPTMAGMVAALSGVFANTYVTRIAEREKELLADHLTTDH